MTLEEVIIYVDAIQAQQVEEYEAKIGDYQMQLAVSASTQSDKGYKQMEKELKKMMYQYRERAEVEPKANDAGWQQLIAFDKKMRRK